MKVFKIFLLSLLVASCSNPENGDGYNGQTPDPEGQARPPALSLFITPEEVSSRNINSLVYTNFFTPSSTDCSGSLGSNYRFLEKAAEGLLIFNEDCPASQGALIPEDDFISFVIDSDQEIVLTDDRLYASTTNELSPDNHVILFCASENSSGGSFIEILAREGSDDIALWITDLTTFSKIVSTGAISDVVFDTPASTEKYQTATYQGNFPIVCFKGF